MAQDREEKNFKDTLNLPRTEFPIRPNAAVDDPAMLARWEKEQLFERSFYHNEGKEKFILHDGPPYANGHIHLGHAYNKILKDIITKSQRMLGKQVPVTPGWDCHGLPIELKVTKEHPGLSRAELKKACRAYAQEWINVQRTEFKELGVLMDWERPYITMSFSYEAATLRAFGELVGEGYIERKNKTVPWCFHCKTVLAQAEIEYQERKDPSIYVFFPLEQRAVSVLFPTLADQEVGFLVWTTTPWTLPLNRAVLLRPETHYVVLHLNDRYLIVAKQLAPRIAALLSGGTATGDIVAEVPSSAFIKYAVRVQHPFIETVSVPVILDQSVAADEGTACVHCAPGAGPIDYDIGIRNNLSIYSPVTDDGHYTDEVQPAELRGMMITDGQIWVLKKLTELHRLMYKTTIRHSYPHCWRCHNGLIFRATKQWFCDLEQHHLKDDVIAILNSIMTVPENSINRLRATVEGRLEWCLSRQRVWGTPIPALLCTTCDYAYITKELIERVAEGVARKGIEYWDEVATSELSKKLPACPSCQGVQWRKEFDILDVWFDAGISHYAVLLQNKELAFPADMYLEGKDQHRGWFQSSLLTSMAIEGVSPMRTIMTHGFTVDARGQKMSKSLGNGVEPRELIAQLGTDGLRLWVASIDCSGDAVVSSVLITNVQEVFRRVRNTCRFLLSNVYDFDQLRDSIAATELMPIDAYALRELFVVQQKIIAAYTAYDITAVFHALGDYCAVDLSSLYLDIIKDRLYCDKADSRARRSAQTVCWYILDTLTRLIAPIMSFTAEQISDAYQKNKSVSIHLQSFATLPDVAQNTDVDASWRFLLLMRSAILKAIEVEREKGYIKHPLEARIILYIDPTIKEYGLVQNFISHLADRHQTLSEFMKEFCIVSQVALASDAAGLSETTIRGFFVYVEHARGTKCPRCWQWQETHDPDGLDARCRNALG
jgi:isoleucyl-tRNA synthetase